MISSMRTGREGTIIGIERSIVIDVNEVYVVFYESLLLRRKHWQLISRLSTYPKPGDLRPFI